MSDYGIVVDARTVRFERLLPGSIERVWSYLVESDKRGRWLATGSMELHVGGNVELLFRHAALSPRSAPVPDKYRHFADGVRTEGRITRCEPPRLLSFTWDPDREASEVTFELSPRDGNVLLVLTHRRLADRELMVDVSAGWHAHLAILADHLQGREPEAFWALHTPLEAEYERRIN